MNKKILSLAIAAIALMASSASAQNRCNNSSNDCKIEKCDKSACKKEACKKENCKKQDCKKENCKMQACKKNVCKPGACDRKKKCNPFAGLNLSQEQQTRIAAITPPCEVIKTAIKNGNVKRGDNMREYIRTVRADYLNSVKQVLSSDQYTKFLENYFINTPAKRGQKDGKFGKGQKHCNKNRQYKNSK